MKTSEQLDANFDKWMEEKMDTLCFQNKNPFTNDEIKSWSKETAEWIIYVVTPEKKRKDSEHEKACAETINRIKDIHGLV